MKKKISLVFTMLFLSAILLPITASAHKGRTDAYGGHYDRSTGEYHYHHGYEAHQHYDMDGDGIPDCPFDYDDKTGQRSGTSSSSNAKSYQSAATKPPEYYTVTKTQEVPVEVIPKWVYYCFAGCVIVILILFGISKSRKHRIEIQNRELQEQKLLAEQELAKVKYVTHENLTLLHSCMVEEFGCYYLYAICRAPPDDYLGEDDLPTSKEKSGCKWGKKYTFYLSGYNSSGKYHRKSCRHASVFCPINALTISRGKNRYSPCAVCYPTLPDLEWAERFLSHKSFFEKHGISIKQDVPKIDISQNPDFGEITLEYVECRALELGLPKETVLKIINQRRQSVGMHPIDLNDLE